MLSDARVRNTKSGARPVKLSDAGFGNKFRQWCNEAGLHHCSAHGLRKAGATIAAENGATSQQLMAIFGWSSLSMAELYARAADQKRLAESAMHMLDTKEQNESKSSPTEGVEWDFFGKKLSEINADF